LNQITVTDITRVFNAGGREVRAVDHASFEVAAGQLTVVLGPSGSGKTTVLNLLGGMDSPTSGSVLAGGVDLAQAGERELTLYRREQVGFVFQFYNLIASLTAAENIALGSQFAADPMAAADALAQVGLGARAGSFPYQMSGGEMQRVAIARAIAKRPKLLLCDEPTGALDSATGTAVFALLRDLSTDPGRSVVVVTHNETLAASADRVVRLRNGQVAQIADQASPRPVGELDL
jgi:putative ABC transport system ATP-binding protein